MLFYTTHESPTRYGLLVSTLPKSDIVTLSAIPLGNILLTWCSVSTLKTKVWLFSGYFMCKFTRLEKKWWPWLEPSQAATHQPSDSPFDYKFWMLLVLNEALSVNHIQEDIDQTSYMGMWDEMKNWSFVVRNPNACHVGQTCAFVKEASSNLLNGKSCYSHYHLRCAYISIVIIHSESVPGCEIQDTRSWQQLESEYPTG